MVLETYFGERVFGRAVVAKFTVKAASIRSIDYGKEVPEEIALGNVTS